MYDNFDEALHALLQDNALDEAKGGLITKNNDQFDYSLHNQPEPEEGDPFLGVYPSATPEVDWRVFFHGGQEAETAYHNFITNPDNGHLSLGA